MTDINTHEAKTKLSKILARVETEHEHFRICRNGKPIAELIPIEETAPDPLVLHPELMGVVFFEDPTAPLDPEDWPEEIG